MMMFNRTYDFSSLSTKKSIDRCTYVSKDFRESVRSQAFKIMH